jgi:hypothetical protein
MKRIGMIAGVDLMLKRESVELAWKEVAAYLPQLQPNKDPN